VLGETEVVKWVLFDGSGGAGPLPLPLVAVVTDLGFNRLPGIEVRFLVLQGGGGGRRRILLRYYTVFNVDPCEGIKVPGTPQRLFASVKLTARR